MAGLNKVQIIGNLGKDPEVRFLPNGGAVANITVATSETWKDKQTGEAKEKTEWHRIVLFGKLAEIAGEYLKKGSKAYFEGQLQTRKWTNQQGQDQYTTEIVLQGFNGVMQMLDSKQQGGQQSQQGCQQSGGFNQSQQKPQQPNQQLAQKQQQAQQSAQQQGGYANQGQQQGQSSPKINPQEPGIDFDDDIPF